MQKNLKINSSPKVHTYLLIILVVGMFLAACKPKANEHTIEPALLPTLTTPEQPIIGSTATMLSPTATSTLLPITTGENSADKAGLIIFSMADGEFNHLFAYHPSYLPVTRLTSGEWDDESPSVSPDGNLIAFSSNRTGSWDIFLLDLNSNSIKQLTNSTAFEGRISWSPDGTYIVFDCFQNEFFDLVIQSVFDPSEKPIQLTDGTSNSFQPDWSPDGSELAFVTDRSGFNEIWLANLQDPVDRFKKVTGNPGTDYSSPVWSPDGKHLAYSSSLSSDRIFLVNPEVPEDEPVLIGSGANPVWMPDGNGILATISLPNRTEILAYSTTDQHLLLPPIPMTGNLFGYDWQSGNLTQGVKTWLSQNTIKQPPSLWENNSAEEQSEKGRLSLVELDGVSSPQPSLSDAVDDSFNALKAMVQKKAGWDFLNTLENSVIPPTSAAMPGILENWLYTGRGIALNLAPYEAGWMVVSREEFAGDLYWRVWIKCKVQDGSCGKPLIDSVWDFKSRSSGDSQAYENGGKLISAPVGYWIDFTELALRYGWERLPAQNNWKSYFQGIQMNVFVNRQGLTWKQALEEIYPQEQVELIIGKNQ